MIGLNPLQFQQMQSGAASSGHIAFGAGNQQFSQNPAVEKNPFETSSVNGISGAAHGINGGVNPAAKPNENLGLVGRLDRMDSSIIKPQYQNEFMANKLDLYA